VGGCEGCAACTSARTAGEAGGNVAGKVVDCAESATGRSAALHTGHRWTRGVWCECGAVVVLRRRYCVPPFRVARAKWTPQNGAKQVANLKLACPPSRRTFALSSRYIVLQLSKPRPHTDPSRPPHFPHITAAPPDCPLPAQTLLDPLPALPPPSHVHRAASQTPKDRESSHRPCCSSPSDP